MPHRNPDGKDACRLGASLKDLGGKGIAFFKRGMGGIEVIGKIKGVTRQSHRHRWRTRTTRLPYPRTPAPVGTDIAGII